MCVLCDTQHQKSINQARRRFLAFAGAAAGYLLVGPALAADAKAPPKPQNVVSADAALELLKAGNARYVQGTTKRHDFKHEREALTKGQNPYAAVLSCADSRISPELAFDSSRGDLFVCRVAGNFANDDVIASLEYAIAVLKTPLIMVLGHGACGAIDATIKSLKDGTTLPGHLPSLVTSLTPAVKASTDKSGDPLDNAIRQNVVMTVQKLKAAAPIISTQVAEAKVRVVGATYRLSDGQVEVFA